LDQLIAEIYRSSNGDRWMLMRHGDSSRLFVRHEPNPSSGGRMSDTDADEFLSVAGSGPEYAALRTILDRLADTASSSQQ
jgi:hypothetical protein